MARKDIGNKLDRENRNAHNDNYKELYKEVNDFTGSITDELYERIIDGAKLNWKEPVSSQSDLPSSAMEGDTRMTRDTGKVYRYDGSKWVEIQQIDAGPVNELDSRLTSQLAETENQLKSIENANAEVKLNLLNHLNNYQNIHPKVLYFENKWNGYEYWMAYTPYPHGDVKEENPCIAVSNDGINWTNPIGLSNPLDSAPSWGYNSDTHLVYRADLNRLEIWWRPFNTTTGEAWIYRRTTTDGINWTAKELVRHAPAAINDFLSPAVIYEDGKYKMWGVNRGTKEVVYSESTDGTSWTNQSPVGINWGDLTPWHLDVIRTDKGLEFAVCAYTPGNNSSSADLYHVLETENGAFTKPKMIIKRRSDPNAFDGLSIYRSSILKIKGIYYVYYSSIERRGRRSMALSTGTNIFGLNGYTSDVDDVVNGDVRIKAGSTVNEFDVSNINTLYIEGPCTIKTFRGGYRNKRLTLVLYSSTASAKLINSKRLGLPGTIDFTLNYHKQTILDLICTDQEGYYWKVASSRGGRVANVNVGGTLTDYDVSDIDTLMLSADTTIEGFVGADLGKKLSVLVFGSATKVTFKYNSSGFVLPGLTDYVLDSNKMGMTFICTDAERNHWRAY